MSTADRIRFVQPDEGIPQPGVCSVCGFADWSGGISNGGRRCITFGVKIKYYGHFLLCDQCLNTVLTQPELDYVPRHELEQTQLEVKAYRERVDPTLDLVRGLRSDITDLLDARLGDVYGYNQPEEDAKKGDEEPGTDIGTPGFFDEES